MLQNSEYHDDTRKMIMKYFVPKLLLVGLKELPYVMLYAILTAMLIIDITDILN